ncbi:hypothetical protein M9H77_33924 [Catharanthus roseus]|uniref:Uncharacterized protein n=1 Tax=Catharanthus roseus TaxID=4058 RepID=A0ACB9ZKK5_CATRO|nr:hypothetical protein M9H77_33924 [Catharanthus roseus]
MRSNFCETYNSQLKIPILERSHIFSTTFGFYYFGGDAHELHGRFDTFLTEHASLLEDFREFDRTRLDLEDGSGSYEQAFLKERATLSRNSAQMDNVISQAQETLKTLVFQRSTFGGINTKLGNVSSRLPTISHILSAIKKKKSMDTLILSFVAAVCTFLIFIYWLTK